MLASIFQVHTKEWNWWVIDAHIFNFSMNAKLFLKVFLLVYTPNSNGWVVHLVPHPHQHLAFSDLYFFTSLLGLKGIWWIYVINKHNLFMWLLTVYPSFWKMAAQVFSHFSNGLGMLILCRISIYHSISMVLLINTYYLFRCNNYPFALWFACMFSYMFFRKSFSCHKIIHLFLYSIFCNFYSFLFHILSMNPPRIDF